MLQQSKGLDEQLKRQRREAEERDAERRAGQLGIPYLNLISLQTPTELKAMELVKEEDARKALLSPLQISGRTLVVATFNPNSPEAQKIINELKQKFEVRLVVCSLTSIDHALSYYQYISEQKEISGSVEINEENIKSIQEKINSIGALSSEIASFSSPYTSQILEIILAGALALNASDANLEPGENSNTLRLRVDGLLHSIHEKFSALVYRAVVTRIKLLSNLKLNVHNEPQDGRFTIKLKDRDIEVRTSVIPSEYGETVVLRLLDPLSLKTELTELGWRKEDLKIALESLSSPNGLILNTGPTGSGKTTTLYAFLKRIANPEIKIITIEDPIEYHLDGISQTQVDMDSGYTFASGLRSILRQDPDVVLVGEIRDKETAEIALHAALTGHLVFSTLHTNDSVGAIYRLIDLGAKPQILGPSISLIIAQRLVRVLCDRCKEKIKLSDSQNGKIRKFLDDLPKNVSKEEYDDFGVWKPKGCPDCGEIGYRGRISLFELFPVSSKIKEVIYKNPTESEIKREVRAEGMVFLQEDGVLKAMNGITSMEEVERATGKISWWN